MDLVNYSDDQARDFGRAMLEALADAPFGALSKSEIDQLVFSSLVTASILDIKSSSHFALAVQLRCSPTKAGNLVFNHRLRAGAELGEGLWEYVAFVRNESQAASGLITLNVADRFARESLIEALKRSKVYTDTSFNRERVIMSVSAFIEACPAVFGAARGAEIAKEIEKLEGDQKRAEWLNEMAKQIAADSAKKGASALVEEHGPTALSMLTAWLSRVALPLL